MHVPDALELLFIPVRTGWYIIVRRGYVCVRCVKPAGMRIHVRHPLNPLPLRTADTGILTGLLL